MSDFAKVRVLSLIVDDQPGVMQKVSMIFARRGINIDSITVPLKTNKDREKTNMILVLKCDDKRASYAKALLHKLIQVHGVRELDHEKSVLRELALVKVNFPEKNSTLKIMEEIDRCGARVLYVNIDFLILEISGDPVKVQQFINSIDPNLKIEVITSGLAAMQI